MKHNNVIKVFLAGCALMTAVSCSDFLNRPSEDNYNVSVFYKTDEQCEQGVNYLYNSPWYDFQRAFIKIGEVMSGNMYWGQSPYLEFTTNGTDVDLIKMSYSLWAVNTHANTVIDNIWNAEGPSMEAKHKYIGEALTLKALAYFFMARTFGEVPIIHDNLALLNSGEYNNVTKVMLADVYEYIIVCLEKAMELLPKNAYIGQYNRIDYYAAEALLAKVYLTKAGLSGTLDPTDLAAAASYAKDVILNSGRTLTPNYEDVFRLSPKQFNATGECLISWQWTAQGEQWTRQNTLQSDLAMEGFSETGDLWGGWGGPSVDLADAFGVSVLDNPSVRVGEKDVRRKATMMMPGDTYSYFWQDMGGFDYLRFLFDKENYAPGSPGKMQCPTGTNNVKHLYGNKNDHLLGTGHDAGRMAYTLPSHILRLSDVYLIYAEALVDVDNATALEYVNYVRERAGADALPAVTVEDIWKERRLELAGEGDNWYDFVRRSYYQMSTVITELKSQRRSPYNGELGDVYKFYYEKQKWDISVLGSYKTEDGNYEVSGYIDGKKRQVWYGDNGTTGQYDNPNVTKDSFKLPFPTEDIVFNENMASSATPQHVDIRETYTFKF